MESVMNNRLLTHLEQEGRIPDEQGGFRWWRSCIDLVYLLREVLDEMKEEKRPVFMVFVDTEKAYDRTWRDGLWYRLWNEGVKGRMWRVLRAMYDGTTAEVRGYGAKSASFLLRCGVRQGAVTSPILYSVFINGLIRRLKSLGLGLVVGGIYVGCFLFADDVVLLAATDAEMRLMLREYEEYARRWRFSGNTDKTKVMVVGARVPKEPFFLHGCSLEVVDQFRYLGVEMQRSGAWGAVLDRLLRKAKQAAGWLNAVGLGHFHFSAKTGSIVFNTMSRSILDFGAEVVPMTAGRLLEAERFQRASGRRVLGCPARTPHEVVYGELGWSPVEYRRDDLRLRYFRRLVLMDEQRAVHRMFRYRKRKWDAAVLAGVSPLSRRYAEAWHRAVLGGG
jgi:hypothetical protein